MIYWKRSKSMQKVLMMLGAILAWAMSALAATHDGV